MFIATEMQNKDNEITLLKEQKEDALRQAKSFELWAQGATQKLKEVEEELLSVKQSQKELLNCQKLVRKQLDDAQETLSCKNDEVELLKNKLDAASKNSTQ